MPAKIYEYKKHAFNSYNTLCCEVILNGTDFKCRKAAIYQSSY